MNLYSATKWTPDAGIKAETFPCGPGKAEEDLNMGHFKAQQCLKAPSLRSLAVLLLAGAVVVDDKSCWWHGNSFARTGHFSALELSRKSGE